MSYDTLRYDVDGDGVATIAMDQPDNRNAMTDELLADLLSAFDAAAQDDAVRCVVLASTHPTTWSAGGNLAGFGSDAPLAHKYLGADKFPRLFARIGSLGKPVVASVDGHCLAGAFGLALACDLIIASDEATFGTPEINVGLFPFMIAAIIYRNIGRKKTTELLLLGERFGAEEAERLGVVNTVVPRKEHAATVADWASRLAKKSPLIMRLGKEAIYRQMDMPFEDALEFLRAQLVVTLATDDAKEGVAAFFEKRDPVWKGQ